MKFSRQYGAWLSLSERLRKQVEMFERYLDQPDDTGGPDRGFCNGLPTRLPEDGIVIYELKVRNSKPGILTELMFYANYVYDMYIGENRFHPQQPDARDSESLRGHPELYRRRGSLREVHGAMLTDAMYPPITEGTVLSRQPGPVMTERELGREALRTVCRTVAPRRGIIPIHGEVSEAFRDLVPEYKAVCMEDGEGLVL